MKLFADKKTQAFGLDISDTSIKVMQINADKAGLVPGGYANIQLPDRIISNHMITSPERLADTIKQALTRARNIQTKYVVCSIPETKSFVRTITIPKMPEAEIDGSIPYELEQDIPVPVDQVYLDWQILNELPDKLELLVTAAPKDYIDSLVESMKLAQLKPVVMEIESQATARAVIGAANQQNTILIVDMATQQTSFIIVDKGILQYTSSVPVAGRAFTESIARNLGISNIEAEKMKQASGLTSESKHEKIRAAILPILDNIVDEIKNVIRFFEEHDSAHRAIQNVLLCGGSAHLQGIAEYLSTRINLGATASLITVSPANPWINLSGAASAPAGFADANTLGYATVIGLALRGVQYENN